MPTNVTLLLKGLLVLYAKKGETTAKVGILRTFPLGHELTITITKDPPPAQEPDPIVLTRHDVKPSLSLEIAPVTPTTIFDETPVDRNQPVQHPKSFAWFVDLENDELYGTDIGADPSGFSSILTINSGGELYTAEKPNESILQVLRPPAIDFEPFGRVALTLGVDFKSATRAVFKNGPKVVFDSDKEPNTNYLIEITHDAVSHLPVVLDANFYYTAVGSKIGLTNRISFLSSNLPKLLKATLTQRIDEERRSGNREGERVLQTLIDKLPEPPAGPEAACFPAYLSRSTF